MAASSSSSVPLETNPNEKIPSAARRRCLGVFTSGGDSQGMNAAIRAVVRMALFKGMRTFFICEGYQGLVDGGNSIKECSWSNVSYIMQKGGTIIGTARCPQFREKEGRLKAAKCLVKAGINNLVIIGGDGSLTGANVFKSEWPDLLRELLTTNQLNEEEVQDFGYLNIVGLVGSIDNDMCGTDMTIGTDSALHRIIEAVDCITSTASSHQRSFIVEVMGRHCGYLALMAGIATGADWVFVPEDPPREGWEKKMCQKLTETRKQGRRLSLIIMSEGAVDVNNKSISASFVKQVIEKELELDTRITVLGHVQRGGKPSAYDRVLSTRMGAAASLVLVRANGEIPSKMIAIQGNEIVEVPLMEHVIRTRSIDQAMKNFEFEKALQLRGRSFSNSIKILKTLENPTEKRRQDGRLYRVAVMNVGAPAGGTNSATRAFVRLLLAQGHTVLGIHEGFEGLLRDDSIQEMGWMEVGEWGSIGGSNLGTNRTKPTDKTIPVIARQFELHRIQALLVIGGFEAFQSLIKLEESRSKYPSLCIPIALIAATVSNNVPGTEYSLGCDTALNMIVSACDTLRQSATGSRKRVFVVEVMGGYCGYLATMGGLAGGADSAYIFEEKFSLKDLQRDVDHLVQKFQHGMERGIIIRNENCSENYTTEFITKMLAEEGKEHFVTRHNVLGHLQQGDRPSPFDRILGTKYASAAVRHLLTQLDSLVDESGRVYTDASDTVCVVGLTGVQYVYTPVSVLSSSTDFQYRMPKEQWWMQLRSLIRILSRHQEDDFIGEQHREGTQQVPLSTQVSQITENPPSTSVNIRQAICITLILCVPVMIGCVMNR